MAGKIEEALGDFLRNKKIKEHSYTRDTEPPVPKENQNALSIGRKLRKTDIEVLQNPFYEGM